MIRYNNAQSLKGYGIIPFKKGVWMECCYFGVCGSCRYEGYEEQLNHKIQTITPMMRPYYEGEMQIIRSQVRHYRARAEFRILHREGRLVYGMHGVAQGSLIPIETCPMVAESISAMMPRLLHALEEQELGYRLFGIDYLCSSEGEMVVSLIYHRRLDEAWSACARRIGEELGIHIIGRSRGQKLILTQDHVTEHLTIGSQSYHYRHIENSFTQPNPRVNEQMIAWALEAVKGIEGELLELYCGAGKFTIPFASVFDRVVATEISKSSIAAALHNTALNGVKNITFVRMSAEEFTQALDGVRPFNRLRGIDLGSYQLSTLFVDPPRSGLGHEGAMFATRFEQVIYISCNPITLAEDLARITQTHEVLTMAMFDQFPYTHHAEMGVMLRRRR